MSGIFQRFMLGGPIMVVLLFLSVTALTVFFQRILFIRRVREAPARLENELTSHLRRHDYRGALLLVDQSRRDTSVRRLLRLGLSHWSLDSDDLRALLDQEVRREAFRWSRGLPFLAMTARIAPLLGLLGTVVGMVEIFEVLPGLSSSPLMALAGGIWKALFTTVAGLTVAIPAVVAHSWLSAKLDDLEETLFRSADFLLRLHVDQGGDPM